jgi:membrane-bound lytic murein transglycosylase B
MKHSLYIFLVLANVSFADYSNHPEAKDLIDSLVNEHDFERSYVIQVLETAQKQSKILDSMSSPAEFTWTWIDIRNYS